MNVSFAGCGFLGLYHVGVACAFKTYAPHILLNKVYIYLPDPYAPQYFLLGYTYLNNYHVGVACAFKTYAPHILLNKVYVHIFACTNTPPNTS